MVGPSAEASSLSSLPGLAGLSTEQQHAYLLQIQRQRAAAAAAAAGQQGVASHQLLMQQQAARAAQMQSSPAEAVGPCCSCSPVPSG
jgi:hypothetical protein